MVRFIIVTLSLTICLPLAVNFAEARDTIKKVPSFLYESTWLVAFITTVIFVYLYRWNKPALFVQLYLLSMAVKLLAALGYCLLMVLEDRQGANLNVIYFFIIYILYTSLEIGFLYRRISRSSRP